MSVQDYALPPPAEKIFPITRHCDLAFTVRRVDANGNPVDIAAGTSIVAYIEVDKVNPTAITATITGPNASVVIPKDVGDTCKNNTRIQVVVDGAVDSPLLVGKLVRFDG